MIARPSGAAMTVSEPLNATTALDCLAALRVRCSLSPSIWNSRMNSPACGVSTHGPTIASSRSCGASANEVSASASSTAARLVASAARTNCLVASPTPAPGPIAMTLRRLSASSASKSFRPSKLRTIALTQRCRVDAPNPGRRCERHHAGSSPRRSLGGHPTVARDRLATQDQNFATLVFVAFRLRPGIAVQPHAGTVLPAVRSDLVKHAGRYANVCQQDIAAKSASRIQQVARLLAKERHRELGWRSGAENHPGRVVEAAGNINRAGGYPACP